MNKHYLELLVQLLALASILTPLVIQKYSKKNRLKHDQHFLDLLRHQAELSQMIQRHETSNAEKKVLQKLREMRQTTMKEIHAECDHPQRIFHPYLILIGLEIIIGYNLLFVRLMKKIAERAIEGVMTWPSVQLLLWGLIFSTSILLTLQASKHIGARIKNPLLLNLSVLVAFNVLVFTLVSVIGFTLKYLDPSVPWF